MVDNGGWLAEPSTFGVHWRANGYCTCTVQPLNGACAASSSRCCTVQLKARKRQAAAPLTGRCRHATFVPRCQVLFSNGIIPTEQSSRRGQPTPGDDPRHITPSLAISTIASANGCSPVSSPGRLDAPFSTLAARASLFSREKKPQRPAAAPADDPKLSVLAGTRLASPRPIWRRRPALPPPSQTPNLSSRSGRGVARIACRAGPRPNASMPFSRYVLCCAVLWSSGPLPHVFLPPST